jgi:NAD(P)-dependent dehydrogenase (short-subunit alcohol dehydrogenase family)
VTTEESRKALEARSSASFAGRTVFITGASSGVGEAVALILGACGAKLGLFARSANRLERLADDVRAAGGSALAHAGDVRLADDIERAVADTTAEFGVPEFAIASAGIGWSVPLEGLDAATWSLFIETNLTGVFNVCRSVGLRMRERGAGSIVTVASGMGLVGHAGYIAYCASKGGVVVMTKALAAELAPQVRVNCLCPGGIETPMTDDDFARHADPEGSRRRALERVPLGRLATAEEIARAAIWLASDDAAYATGSSLSIDGGTTMV